MKNYSYHKKYHYLLKYFIMAFPLICYCLSYFIKDNEIFINLNSGIEDFINGFPYFPINAWYTNLVNIVFETDILTNYSSLIILLSYYPLYILWVYIMDLILDIFAMVPKLAHKLLYKLGGGIDD